MHAGAVPPYKERLVSLDCAVHEIQGCYSGFVVDCFHALDCQRSGIFDSAISIRMYYATWAEFLFEFRIFRIVRMFRLLLSIQMIEVSEELIEAVIGR